MQFTKTNRILTGLCKLLVSISCHPPSNIVPNLSSLGSSTYSRESTSRNGSSMHFMDFRDFNGNSPHSSYAMFAQSEYPPPPPPPNGYAAYNPAAYHYSNPYINPTGANGYPLTVSGEYNPNTFGMPPPQHLPQDIKLPKDR